MKPPVVTVLMPAYNAERFIDAAIRSVLSQTFNDFELILIDDCSRDNTKRIAEAFKDSRVRVIHNEENLGLVKALNRGLGEARGKYLARLDADDLCLPTRFSEQVSALDREPVVGLVASWTEVIDDKDRTRGFGKWVLSPEAIYYVLHFRQCLTHSSVMFRTRLAQDLGGYSEDAVHAEDFDLWRRLSQIGKIVQLPRVLAKWRMHSSSVMGTVSHKVKDSALSLAKKYVRQVTGDEWTDNSLNTLVESRNARSLSPEELSDFPGRLKKLQECVLREAPDFYDKNELRWYIDVETAKYGRILRHLGTPFQSAGTARVRLLGIVYYLTCYYGLPLTSRFAPKSHF